MSSHKIKPRHLERRAVVYLRQSSPGQVQHNTESQRLQYALAGRARELGWKEVEVVDVDLGRSASLGAGPRVGFDALISAVALGEVGLVLAREVSRLSRTDKDWCRLLEVCQVFDTLIGDEEHIYDPSYSDDELMLGIKGTLSAFEIRVLRMRMLKAAEAKAARGELLRLLPPGYVKDATGVVVKDPDQRVQDAISLVFRKFREIWSVRQTFKWFHDHEIELPVNKSQRGQMVIAWQLPTQSFVGNVLRNPFYAGAYVYGRRPTETRLVDGKLVKRVARLLSPESCRVFIPDHHEGYIAWEAYEDIQRMIRRNSLNLATDESVTAVRAGQGLLTGLVRCGRCGRKLHVRYWGRAGTGARYMCKGDFDAGGSYCLAFGGVTVDRRLSEEVLGVISPLGVEASLQAIDQLCREEDERQTALVRKQQQLEYEAQRAFDQYDEVDPRNRLVAAELERRWNAKLEEVNRVQEALAGAQRQRRALSGEDRQRVLALGMCFADVWHSDHCPPELKKKIMRTVIEEVVVDLDEDSQMLRFVIHWKGGVHTEVEMPKPQAGSAQRTSMEALEIIRKMAPRYGDDRIAGVLNRLGHRTGKGKRWSQTRVKSARSRHSIRGRRKPDPEILTLEAAATHCGVSAGTISRLLTEGLLKGEQVVPYAPWEIRRSDLDTQPVRGIIEHLRKTGKLVLEGGVSGTRQPHLF